MTDLNPVDAMTTDYRALCAELVDSLHKHTSMWEGHEIDLVTRARALLDRPVAEGPTDEELTLTYAYAVAAAVDNKRGPFTTEAAEAAQLAGLRAVLAKWGANAQ
jgi:hypothetical protein